MLLRSPDSRDLADRSSRVEVWRPRTFNSLELHAGFGVTVDYPRHWHDEIYICAVLEGESRLEVRDADIVVTSGALAIVPAGAVHANQKADCSFRVIFVDPRALRTLLEQYREEKLPGIDFRAEMVPDTAATAKYLSWHRSLERPSSELAIDHSLIGFFHDFVVRYSVSPKPHPSGCAEDNAVQRAKRFLDENYADAVLLRDLARLSGLSPYHLNRSFCQRLGMPPHAYQLQLRISYAKSLLRQGRSGAEAASLAGFFDQSHFAHHFKRSEGVTPGQYQRYWKSMQENQIHTEYHS